MVKPAFANLEIDIWVHRGKLGKTEVAVCVFHKSREIGAQFLDALTELKGDACPGRRTLTFAACPRKSALRTLTLLFVPESDSLKVLNIRRARDSATIEMTALGLALVMDAFSSWLGGAEDFCVSVRSSSLRPKQLGGLDRESGELWFWGPGYEPS